MNHYIRAIKKLENLILDKINAGDNLDKACLEVLSTFDDLNNIQEEEVFQLALAFDLPQQYYKETMFGYFNVTLIQNEHFNIQIYVMNNIDTEIHDHSFIGGFKLLTGHTIHKTFDFKQNKLLERGLQQGHLSENSTLEFKPGDFAILNTEMIHQILRLASVNITLIVTNVSQNFTGRMNHYYLYPHLKLENLSLKANLTRKINALSLLFKKNKDIHQQFTDFMKKRSLFELLILLTRMNIYQFGLSYQKLFHQEVMNHAYKELERRDSGYFFTDYKRFLLNQKKKLGLVKDQPS